MTPDMTSEQKNDLHKALSMMTAASPATFAFIKDFLTLIMVEDPSLANEQAALNKLMALVEQHLVAAEARGRESREPMTEKEMAAHDARVMVREMGGVAVVTPDDDDEFIKQVRALPGVRVIGWKGKEE